MLFRNQVRDTAQQILIAANTLAGAKVFTTRSQPVAGGEPPLLLLYSPVEKGESLGAAGIPRFRSVLTLVIQPMVSGTDDEEVGAALDLLCEQAINTLLSSPQFLTIPPCDGKGRAIEDFKFLHTTSEVKQNGQDFLGSAVIQLGIQYLDAYAPTPGVPLQQITVTGDSPNLFSPAGTFTDVAEAGFPDAPATPSPRTRGPDGRAEVSFVIPFQTPDPQKG